MKFETRQLKDDIYEVPSTCVVMLLEDLDGPPEEEMEEVVKFGEQYPNFRIACAYETGACLLLSEPPTPYKGRTKGSGFNYGSTNLLEDCPPRLLILAEND